MTPKPYALAIFDFDGVLADSARWMAGAMASLALRHRFRQVDDDEIAMLRHRSSREILAYLGIPSWRLPAIARDMRRMSEAAEPGAVRLFDDVPDVLAALRKHGVTLAVVSSNSEAAVRRVLGPQAALIDDYDCGAGLFGKAARFIRVARRAKVAALETLCIGDETRDLEAAAKAGMPACAATWGYAARDALVAKNPAHVADEIADLLKIFIPQTAG